MYIYIYIYIYIYTHTHIATLFMQNLATTRMLHDCTVENAMTPAQQHVYTNDNF
jgi:hypothetical protein